MLTATFLAIFFVPLFFVIIQWLSELRLWRRKPSAPAAPDKETQP
jgi:hypothetical protein